MSKGATISETMTAPKPVSHNLVGQRLGRKGQETRERIVAAMLTLLADQAGPPVTLTAVAKEAGVGMTSLYLYFPDISDLLLAALGCVTGAADEAFMYRILEYWPDDRLELECREFQREHYRFWRRHARLLHMRNSLADANHRAVMQYRVDVSRPILEALAMQMGAQPGEVGTPCAHLATVTLIGIERTATVVTPVKGGVAFHGRGDSSDEDFIDGLLCAEARLIELAIRYQRGLAAEAASSRR